MKYLVIKLGSAVGCGCGSVMDSGVEEGLSKGR